MALKHFQRRPRPIGRNITGIIIAQGLHLKIKLWVRCKASMEMRLREDTYKWCNLNETGKFSKLELMDSILIKF